MESRDTEFAFLNSWAAHEAANSPLFRRELDDYRQLIRVEHPRAGGRGVDYSLEGLEELVAAGRKHPASRPRAHRNTDLPTDDGNRWALDCLKRCRRIAGTRLGGWHMAAALHELARQDTGHLAVEWLGWAPVGSRASAGAAHITGASHGTGTVANRQAYYRIVRPRVRPQNQTGFSTGPVEL
jgi:hypothetical protein